jgi:hypothetical protein
MISIRRILGLLALAGTIGLGAESRARAQTIQPKSAGVATAVQRIQFAQLLLGQERRSISRETTLIRQQDQVLSRPGQFLTPLPENQRQAVSLQSGIAPLESTAVRFQPQLNLSIQRAMTTKVEIDQTLASVDPSALQRSLSLAGQFRSLQGRLALTQTQIDPIVARPPFGGRPPATPFQ